MYSEVHLQELYQACCTTDNLWHGSDIFGIEQFVIEGITLSPFKRSITKRIRLGQLAEQFIFNQIETNANYSLIAENIQIKTEQRTLGELDALVREKNSLVHLEIVYKFYVYDPDYGSSELEHWIGPNRKDSLIEKLNKLLDKQLPLLYDEPSSSVLDTLGIKVDAIKQNVLFKAQLFVPYQTEVTFEKLNSECVYGFYIREKQLDQFSNYEFYIPIKYNWLLQPNNDVVWINFNEFNTIVKAILSENQSPLFWMRSLDGLLQKAFLVWW